MEVLLRTEGDEEDRREALEAAKAMLEAEGFSAALLEDQSRRYQSISNIGFGMFRLDLNLSIEQGYLGHPSAHLIASVFFFGEEVESRWESLQTESAVGQENVSAASITASPKEVIETADGADGGGNDLSEETLGNEEIVADGPAEPGDVQKETSRSALWFGWILVKLAFEIF